MNQKQSHSLAQRLNSLAAFQSQFEQPGFEFGRWEQFSANEPGVIAICYYTYSDVADAFTDMTYEHGWILSGFDWPTWKGTAEAAALRDDPETLAEATYEQLAQLLTVLVRQERFSEGSLAAAYESGLLTGIVRRAAQLEVELGDIKH